MSNPEHIKVLKQVVFQGVEVWNEWRRENLSITPELDGVHLERDFLDNANLEGAYLDNAHLCGVKLNRANLKRAHLIRADLSPAYKIDVGGEQHVVVSRLREADLTGAVLDSADLSGADLTNAVLQGADLRRVCMRETRLYGAVLEDAMLGMTIFSGVDLAKVKIEGAHVVAPCSIDIDSLVMTARSLADVPEKQGLVEKFLRECGLPDDYLDLFRSHVGSPIQMYSAFISYSHADSVFACKLFEALQNMGIRCWHDEHQMLPGDDIRDQIDRGIRLWDKVLLCCSKSSLNSYWVDKEIERALRKEELLWKERSRRILAIIPLNLDGYLFEWDGSRVGEIRNRFAANFEGWGGDPAVFEQQMKKVVRALRVDDDEREKALVPKL